MKWIINEKILTAPATGALKILDTVKKTNPTLYVVPIVFILFFISFSIACFVFLKGLHQPINSVQQQNENEQDEKV